MFTCVVIVRNDLNMSCGKISAQCCHGVAQAIKGSSKHVVREWMKHGEKMIILQTNTISQLDQFKKQANKHKLFAKIIYDAGHTEVDVNTPTVCVIGPDREDIISPITKNLKLL